MVDAFTMESAGVMITGTLTVLEETGAIGVPFGGVPTTDAVLSMVPASRSACVTVWVAVQVVVAPGASGVVGQEMPTAFGSLTVTTVMVTLPALVTLKL